MKRLCIYFFYFTTLALVSPYVTATTFPVNYQATYEVSRGGKVLAEQTTTFESVTPNQYTLTDITQGTRGLASFTGFKRSETTHFEFNHDQIITIEHSMRQKVAFKNKYYQFKLQKNNTTITGKSKQAFTIETALKPISSHMLPLWIGSQVCQESSPLTELTNVPVLKSKLIKNYDFTVIDEGNHLYRVERIYPAETQRSSQIWLDKSQNCLPVKTHHKEAEKPAIETKLLTHKQLKQQK